MECRFPVQGQARKSCRDRPQSCGALSGRRQRPADRRPRARERATGGYGWPGALVCSFDEALADVFALQDKITTQIAGTLAIRVSQAEQRRVIAKPTENLEAYDYVLRARPALLRPERASTVEARALLRRAIEIDPNYAAAYAALAETYLCRHIDGLGGIPDRIPEPRGGNGKQGAEPRRFRRAGAHHPRPHPYFLSPISRGEGGAGPCDRDQSERRQWPSPGAAIS